MILNLERFVGKVAVVTGASSGIGASIVEELVKHGVIVAGLARRSERIQDLAEQLNDEPGKLFAFKCDMTVEEEIVQTLKNVIEKLGDIHILVNNAGLLLPTDLINGDAAMWKTMLNTNVWGLCIATREAIQNMKEKRIQGHIVHLNSIAGHQTIDLPNMNIYGATKYAVTALTDTLMNDLARENLPIKVTSISPGVVETEFFDIAEKPLTEMPFKVYLTAADICEAVIYALSTSLHVNVKEITILPLQSRLE